MTDTPGGFYMEPMEPSTVWGHNILVAEITLESMLHNLIGRCRKAQLSARGVQQQYINPSWIDEFCTVKLMGPRQTGHSSAVLNIAKQYDAIIVAQTQMMAKVAFKGYKKAFGRGQLGSRSHATRAIPADVIIMDGFDKNPLTTEERDELEVRIDKTETFVMVYVG